MKLFNVGTKKKGNDGNIWIIYENESKIKKWKKLRMNEERFREYCKNSEIEKT